MTNIKQKAFELSKPLRELGLWLGIQEEKHPAGSKQAKWFQERRLLILDAVKNNKDAYLAGGKDGSREGIKLALEEREAEIEDKNQVLEYYSDKRLTSAGDDDISRETGKWIATPGKRARTVLDKWKK